MIITFTNFPEDLICKYRNRDTLGLHEIENEYKLRLIYKILTCHGSQGHFEKINNRQVSEKKL
jgi:hypothetical protein